jgi:hypothetical protein
MLPSRVRMSFFFPQQWLNVTYGALEPKVGHTRRGPDKE